MHRILSEQFGTNLVDRGDGHILIQLLSEDDEHWSEHGETFSSFWLDDLIKVLTLTKAIMSTMVKEPYGWRFPDGTRTERDY